MSKTILITGASKGFGRIWTEAFLQQGYQVAATARNIEPLNDLVSKYGESIFPFSLDVNDREAAFAAVKKVHQHFGKIDVLINNAGYALFGAIEEASEQEINIGNCCFVDVNLSVIDGQYKGKSTKAYGIRAAGELRSCKDATFEVEIKDDELKWYRK